MSGQEDGEQNSCAWEESPPRELGSPASLMLDHLRNAPIRSPSPAWRSDQASFFLDVHMSFDSLFYTPCDSSDIHDPGLQMPGSVASDSLEPPSIWEPQLPHSHKQTAVIDIAVSSIPDIYDPGFQIADSVASQSLEELQPPSILQLQFIHVEVHKTIRDIYAPGIKLTVIPYPIMARLVVHTSGFKLTACIRYPGIVAPDLPQELLQERRQLLQKRLQPLQKWLQELLQERLQLLQEPLQHLPVIQAIDLLMSIMRTKQDLLRERLQQLQEWLHYPPALQAIDPPATAIQAIDPPAIQAIDPPPAIQAIDPPAIQAIDPPPAIQAIDPPPATQVIDPPAIQAIDPPAIQVIDRSIVDLKLGLLRALDLREPLFLEKVSSVPIPPRWRYDVFLSFRGSDARWNIVGHLYAKIQRCCCKAFRDDYARLELRKAIVESRITLVGAFVSKRYFPSSRWWLVLEKILACRKTFPQTVLIFVYDEDEDDKELLVVQLLATLRGDLSEEISNEGLNPLMEEQPDSWIQQRTCAANRGELVQIDSLEQKSPREFLATLLGAHAVRADHSWLTVSHSEKTTKRQPLKRKCRSLALEDQEHFRSRSKDVVESLGISIKRSCRLHGIGSWPFRQNGGMPIQIDSLEGPTLDAIDNERDAISAEENDSVVTCLQGGSTINTQGIISREPLQNGGGMPLPLDSLEVPTMDAINNGRVAISAEGNYTVVTCLQGSGTIKTQEREHRKSGVRIEILLEDILKCSKMRRGNAARKLKVSVPTLKRVCRKYSIPRWPPRNINEVCPPRPSRDDQQGGVRQQNSDLPSKQASASVAHIKRHDAAFQDANMEATRVKHEDGLTLSSGLVELQQQVTHSLISPSNSLEPLQNGGVQMQLDSLDQPTMVAINHGMDVISAEHNNTTVTCLQEGTLKTQEREQKKSGVKIEIPLKDILKYSAMSRGHAARELKVSISTLKRVCRDYGIHQWPPCNINEVCLPQPSRDDHQEEIRQLNSDVPSNQASASVAHIQQHDVAFQDANTVTIKAKYLDCTIKFRLTLPPTLVELQQQVAERLNLEAGTYYIKYRDEECDLILIACNVDLQDCIRTSKSLGSTAIVVLLEPKQPITH